MKIKSFLRRAKDVVFRGRKRRREQILNLGTEVSNLYQAVARVDQQSVTQAEAIEATVAKVNQQSTTQAEAIQATVAQIDSNHHANHTLVHELKTRFGAIEKRLIDNQIQFSARLDELQWAREQADQQITTLLSQQEKLDALEREQVELLHQIHDHRDHLNSLKAETSGQRDIATGHQSAILEFQQQFVAIHQVVDAQAETIRSFDPVTAAENVCKEYAASFVAENVVSTIESELGNGQLAQALVRQQTAIQGLEHRMAVAETVLQALSQEQRKQGFRPLGKLSSASRALTVSPPAPPELNLTEAKPIANRSSKFNLSAYDFYSRKSGNQQTPFIYLDVKSIPRSGLHYLQRSLQTVLEKRLSFCEWYQEPGCCKQMPCALTCYGKGLAPDNTFRMRMIKSHDFEGNDPIFPHGGTIRRVILIRDPLYALTSYWNLQSLHYNLKLLQKNGINAVKINYLHEKPLLDMAFEIIDREGELPSVEDLTQWLEKSKRYMLEFVSKWGQHVPSESIVRYRDVNDYVSQFFNEFQSSLPSDALARFRDWTSSRKDGFQARSNPFASNSQRMTEHLKEQAELFQKCAAEIVEEDETGLFASCLEQEQASAQVGSTALSLYRDDASAA